MSPTATAACISRSRSVHSPLARALRGGGLGRGCRYELSSHSLQIHQRPRPTMNSHSRPMPTRIVVVNDRMQQGYQYECVAPIGRGFDAGFTPELTPRDVLRLGVFCGKYMTDTRDEFPANWFTNAKLAPNRR